MLALILTCVSTFFAALWLGKLLGYKEGLRDGIEIERESWLALDDDDYPGGDGGGDPLPIIEIEQGGIGLPVKPHLVKGAA